MDLPVGEEFQTNLALKDTKVTQLLQDMERSALDGCVIFTLKQEDKILDGKILFEVGKVIGASLETDNNVLEVGTRALRSVIQEINVSDGYIDIQRFTPDQIELTKEMNTESLIQDTDTWEIIEKASLERPPVKRTTISKETGVSDIAKGFDQMGAGVGLNSSATKKGPPPLEMLEAAGPKKETVPKPQEASAMDILDAFSTKEVGPPKMEKPLPDIFGPPPPRDSVVPDLTPPPTKSEFDIFGDIVPKQESKVEMPKLEVPATESLPADLKDLMSLETPPIPPTMPQEDILLKAPAEKVTLPKKWYIRKLEKMGDLKSAIKQVATLSKGNHDLLKMDESFLREGFVMSELTETHLEKLAYVYEITNHATCLITGDKTAGFDIIARVTDSKATYLPQLIKLKLVETKHSEKDIMIYKTTNNWKLQYKSLL